MTVFHLPEKLDGNQYLEVLRILAPSHILVLVPVSAKIWEVMFISNWLIFKIPLTKVILTFTVTISNFPQACEEPVHLWKILE